MISCPSFASFKFSCQSYHVISIDSLTFSPVLLDDLGECSSDWSAECRDDQSALEYAINQCSSRESCSLISYQLRSRTKCTYHQVNTQIHLCVYFIVLVLYMLVLNNYILSVNARDCKASLLIPDDASSRVLTRPIMSLKRGCFDLARIYIL